MFKLMMIFLFFYQLSFTFVDPSSLLFTINDLRYSLSDRILTLPKFGSIRGIHIDYQTNYSELYRLVNVQAFLGLRYASFQQRFEPSKERFHFNSNLQLEKLIDFGPACPQIIFQNQSRFLSRRSGSFVNDYYPKLLKFIQKQSEHDCLTMNIYQPYDKNLPKTLPVLLFIHGDGYEMGTAAAFDGSILASYTKSVVVTINYRLGPFGFLYVSPESAGNYALQDIYTGLHWLKNYVSYFNGDPDRISIYGTGSGGVLASLVVMMETVNGGTKKRRKSLVHRLIVGDKTFLAPSETLNKEEMKYEGSKLFSKMFCSSSSCLKNESLMSVDDLLEASKDIRFGPLEEPFPFDQSNSKSLRRKFFDETDRILPENLSVLLIGSSTNVETEQFSTTDRKSLLELVYTKWNLSSNQFQFDPQSLNYHKNILGPLFEYGKSVSAVRSVHLVENLSNKFHCELPFTFGFVLAPSMSVFNQTFFDADENDRRQSLKFLDLLSNFIQTGDINKKSPFCRSADCHENEIFPPLFPQLNVLFVKDGRIEQERGRHSDVHFLFNNFLSVDQNEFTQNVDRTSSKTEIFHLKYSLMIGSIAVLICLFNGMVCLRLNKSGRACRKRQYRCLAEKKVSSSNSSPSSIEIQRSVTNSSSSNDEQRTTISISHSSNFSPEAIV